MLFLLRNLYIGATINHLKKYQGACVNRFSYLTVLHIQEWIIGFDDLREIRRDSFGLKLQAK